MFPFWGWQEVLGSGREHCNNGIFFKNLISQNSPWNIYEITTQWWHFGYIRSAEDSKRSVGNNLYCQEARNSCFCRFPIYQTHVQPGEGRAHTCQLGDKQTHGAFREPCALRNFPDFLNSAKTVMYLHKINSTAETISSGMFAPCLAQGDTNLDQRPYKISFSKSLGGGGKAKVRNIGIALRGAWISCERIRNEIWMYKLDQINNLQNIK